MKISTLIGLLSITCLFINLIQSKTQQSYERSIETY